MRLNELTIEEAHRGLKNRDFSARDLISDCLLAIKEKNREINAFITIFENEAIKRARAVDEKIAKGEEIGVLEGIPLAIKDNILIRGTRCTAGSKILENYTSAYDATAAYRLQEAGAIFLGKTNMDEFACGSSTENSFFGPTKNPLDQKLVPGGSSGGSAAALASDMCLGALGSDTGGSVRQPAALCGLVGFKPSYGRVSRYGLMAMASSLDQISPFGRTAKDAAILFRAIAGPDINDSTTIVADLDLNKEIDFSQLKVGLPKEYFSAELDRDIKEVILEKIQILKAGGAQVREVSLPLTKYALPVYYIIMPSEVSSNLARFDGIRYGFSTYEKEQAAGTLLEVYRGSRAEGFGPEVRRRIMIGTYALSSGYYDAYYKKASRVRAAIRHEFEDVFQVVDCLVTPTSPSAAWPLGEKINDPVKMYLSDIYTVSANVAGLPAISVPAGEIDGLPVGLQIMAKPFDDNLVLKVAQKLYC